MPKILVALDGSPGSERALEVAVRLAQQDGRQVAAVAVLENPADPHLKQLVQGIQAHSRQNLEAVLQAAANFARSRGVQLLPILREGHAAETIIACAVQQGTEVLVLGSSGTSAAGMGLGGTADQVSSHSPCTVMIVK
jgi:nucleotide-binding universal stress UspA family protein